MTTDRARTRAATHVRAGGPHVTGGRTRVRGEVRLSGAEVEVR